MRKKKKSGPRKKKAPSKKKKVVHTIKRVIRRGAERAGHPLQNETCSEIAKRLVRKRPSRRNLPKELSEITIALGGHPSIAKSFDFAGLDVLLEPIRQQAVDFSDLDQELDRTRRPRSE